MTKYELSSNSRGNIGLFDRISRVVWGVAILFATLHISIAGEEAYPMVKLVAALIVLTGIVGWDPLNAAMRYGLERLGAADKSSTPGKPAL